MTRIEQPASYHDLQGLEQLRAEGLRGKDKDAALMKAAKQFESIFFSMLLKSMRQANEAFEDEGPFNSRSVKFYRDMFDQQLAVEMAQTGAMGLADIIYRQLGGKAQGYTPAQVIRSDGDLQALMQRQKKPESSSLPAPIQPAAIQSSKPEQVENYVEVREKVQMKADATGNERQAHFNNPASFVQALIPLAEKAAKKLGVSPHALVAQAALETGWGQKVIPGKNGQSSNNLFNIKADRAWQGEKATVSTLEFRDGIGRKEKANFRSYSSIEDSFDDYVAFLQGKDRYQEALKQGKNSEKYFEALQKAGYATDPNYANKLKNVLKNKAFAIAKDFFGQTLK
ncbi:flagellar assembly peptidoglycan hydrolase FlgJ [Algicola sagamiensis]|uniref:flagellar assembly peptidoglycan hydrolase FlgJ n=1 Tax=Algicola sagamiensis TaxID=163869 RepID=UPI00036122CA|nr:flagellar assembly peptidoglycan hydrolase FlgJ [Algicola sagamiensis]